MLKMMSTFRIGYNAVARGYLHSFSRFCFRNLQNPGNSPKIRTYIAVQGHPRSSILVSIESSYAAFYQTHFFTVFEILTHFENSLFFHPPLFDAHQRRNALRYQVNVIYTPLKSTWATIPSLTLRINLHLFSRCCLPQSRKHAKFRHNLTLQQFKIIQGHRPWCQWKANM